MTLGAKQFDVVDVASLLPWQAVVLCELLATEKPAAERAIQFRLLHLNLESEREAHSTIRVVAAHACRWSSACVPAEPGRS